MDLIEKESDIIELKKLTELPMNSVILSHRNPDGDALGSSLALAGFLRKFNHRVELVMPSEYPAVFEYLKGIQEVIIYDSDPMESKRAIEQADLIFCLDFNSLERIDKVGFQVKKNKKARLIMIDHHIDPEPFYDIGFSRPASSSTSEMVYEVIDEMGMRDKIDPYIGEALLTGIITDTGSFKHNTNSKTYQIVGQLKAIGVDDYFIQDKINNSLTEKQLRLLGHCLANRMEILPEKKAGIIYLTKKDFENFDIERGDTEGVINYLMMVKMIQVAVFIRQQTTIIKLSFRSKGDISVQMLASKYFNGGGHKNASGGYLHTSLRHAIDKVKEVLPIIPE